MEFTQTEIENAIQALAKRRCMSGISGAGIYPVKITLPNGKDATGLTARIEVEIEESSSPVVGGNAQ